MRKALSDQETDEVSSAPAWAYIVPVAVFLVITQLESFFRPHSNGFEASPDPYPLVYCLKIAVVCVAAIVCRAAWRDICPDWKTIPIAVGTGLAVFAEWILVERWIPYPHVGARAAFNPFESMGDPTIRIAFVAARFFGLVLLVPVIEELFWRSFALRYLTSQSWQSVAPWQFSLSAFAMMCGGFAIAHPEWLAALICAAAYGWLLRQTRSLFACIVAHGVTNLALGIYVLQTGNWRLW